MKAYVNGSHYYLYLDIIKKEIVKIYKEPLEASLQEETEGRDLGKKVVLALDKKAEENKVEYIPPESAWEELKEIHVTISLETCLAAHTRGTIFRKGINSYQLELADTSQLI